MSYLKLAVRWLVTVVALAVLAGIAFPTVAPDVIHRAFPESLIAAWERVGGAVIDHDLTSMAEGLDEARAELERAKSLRHALAQRLQDLKVRCRDVEARSKENRSILEQVANLLEQPGNLVIVDGRAYDRGIVERDADRYLHVSVEIDGELARLEVAIRAITAEISRVDRHIEATDRALCAKASSLAVLEATAEARRIRQGLAALGDSSPWETRAARVDRILRPFDPASEAREGNEPAEPPDIRGRLAVYLARRAPE
jgi:hypothetical protein